MNAYGQPISMNASPAMDGIRTRAPGSIARPTVIALVLCVMTQKIAIPMGGGGIESSLFICYGLLALLLFTGRAHIEIRRLILYSLVVGACAATQVAGSFFHKEVFSLQSLLLLSGIYFIYVFQTHIDRSEYIQILKSFQVIALVIAGLVFLGWAMQIVGLGMLNMEKFIPSSMLFRTYVYIQPVHWGSPFTKANGFFMLETSHTSQLLCMALVIELALFKRGFFMLTLFAALLATFGGTGLLMLALCSPVILVKLSRLQIIVILLCIPLAFLGAQQIGLLDNIRDRSDSFSKEGSSANGRFIAPAEQLQQTLTGDFSEAMLGIGAGNSKIADGATYKVALPKIMSEYGLAPALLWLAFTIFVVFGRGVPGAVSWPLFLQLQLLNAALLVPIHSAYCLLLAALFTVKPDRPREETGFY